MVRGMIVGVSNGADLFDRYLAREEGGNDRRDQ